MGWLKELFQSRRVWLAAMAPPILSLLAPVSGHSSNLPAPPGPRGERTAAEAAIEGQQVCIGSTVRSAGVLSDVLYYRAVPLDSTHVAVGYFAFFSEERPWGDNWLTWSVLPALAVDLVYSHALLVAPGLQRLLYGSGDVEGVGVVYEIADNGTLRLDHAVAEDAKEKLVELTRAQAFAIDPARATFYSSVWSHQLGATDARPASGNGSPRPLAYDRCYGDGSIRPLPEFLERDFRLDGRAPPAHVERLEVRDPYVRAEPISVREPQPG